MRENKIKFNSIARKNNNYWTDLFIEAIKLETSQLKKYQSNTILELYNGDAII
ncbi:MAG TPA: hypothetical protein VFG45_08735 [Candidatus Nitrosocosmicus sp.]|nr:hypothetical protein [Candidatus Nitrosocosmicus sp.]